MDSTGYYLLLENVVGKWASKYGPLRDIHAFDLMRSDDARNTAPRRIVEEGTRKVIAYGAHVKLADDKPEEAKPDNAQFIVMPSDAMRQTIMDNAKQTARRCAKTFGVTHTVFRAVPVLKVAHQDQFEETPL